MSCRLTILPSAHLCHACADVDPDVPIVLAAYVLNQSIPRPRIPIYHDYVRPITTERPHLFRSVGHMELSEARTLARLLGVNTHEGGHYKLSEWDRLVVFLVASAQGSTVRHLESHLHLSKSAISLNSAQFSERIVNKLNHDTSGTCGVVAAV